MKRGFDAERARENLREEEDTEEFLKLLRESREEETAVRRGSSELSV